MFGAILQLRVLTFTRPLYVISSLAGIITFILSILLPIFAFRTIKKADPRKFDLGKY